MTAQERNVRTIEAMYDAERARDIDTWATFWAEDARQTFFLSNPQEPVVGKAALVEGTRRKFADRPPYENLSIVEGLADPSKVLARLQLTIDEPGAPTVHVWSVFIFDEDGLILEHQEIADTGVPGPATGE